MSFRGKLCTLILWVHFTACTSLLWLKWRSRVSTSTFFTQVSVLLLNWRMCVLLPQMKLFSSSSLARSVHVALSVPGGAPAVETGWWPGELKPAKSDLLTLSKFLRDESLMRNLSASFPFQTKCDTVLITKTLGIIVLFLLNTWSNESWHHYSTFLFEPAGGTLPALLLPYI